MGPDGDAGHDRFDVAAVVEERGEAGPRLLVHAVPFVEDADAAGTMAVTKGEAWYWILPLSARTGVTSRSSGRVSAVHW